MCADVCQEQVGGFLGCIARTLDKFEAGLERGDDARNEMMLGFQPVIRTTIHQMLDVHRIPKITQDREDVINVANLVFLTKVYEDIRKLRSRHRTKKGRGRPKKGQGLKPVRGPGARRSARVVRTILVRMCGRVVKKYVNQRLNDYPTIADDDLRDVFASIATDHGKAAREMEKSLDREDVLAVARAKMIEHLSLRRRRTEVVDVVTNIADIAIWERYNRGDEIAANWVQPITN